MAARVAPINELPATNELDLAIGLPLRHRSELADLLRQLYDPNSPNFRCYLTPAQFTEAFGPTKQQYEAVLEFAVQNGLRVVAQHPNRTLLSVRESVANVERALHVRMGAYPHPKEARTYFAPDREPSLPEGLLPWTNLQYVVTATSTNALLQFSFRNDQSAFALDDITLALTSSARFEKVERAQGSISFTWTGLAGLNYQVQSTTDLGSNAWQNRGNPVQGQNGSLTFSDAMEPHGQRFYRLVELP